MKSVKGQELYGKYLNHEQGLLSSECYDINHDEKGYLIVGTPYGPQKYDGEKFIPICTNLPLERRVMYDFEKDPRGNIYLLNSKMELFRLQNDKAIWIGPKNRSEFSNSNLFTKLYYANDGFYISTYTEFLKFSFKSRKVQYINNTKPVHLKYTYYSKAPFPFIKYLDNTIIYRDLTIEFPESNQYFKFDRIRMSDTREDEVMVGNTTYLLIYMKLFKKVGDQITILNFDRILFMEYFYDRLWLCTLDGLIELDREGNFIHHHFKGQAIGGVTPLKSGGIAVSLNQKGIFISSNIHNRIHYNISPTAATRINGMDLIGSSNGEVFKYADSKFKKITQLNSFNSRHKRSAHDDIYDISLHRNRILLNTGAGTAILTTDFKNVIDRRDYRLGCFGFFPDKENMYFIERKVLSKFTFKNLTTLPFPHRGSNVDIDYIQCHARLNDSIVILGTNTGLLSYNTKTDRFRPLDAFKKELRITGIHIIGKDKMLVSTRFDGIYVVYKNKIIRKITVPCISIASILLYRNLLIVRGNDGIYIQPIDPAIRVPWYKFFSGETKNMFILKKNLLIAFKEDMIIKRLSDYQLNYKPEIVLNSFQLGAIKMSTFPRSIPPGKSISLDLDVLQFDASKLDLYYILRGENIISQQVEGTKINFDALKNGKYQLKIHPVIDGKIQFNNSKTFRFTIEKTFWESTVFYIATIILLVSMIISVLLIINLRRKRRSSERAELESRLNEYRLLAVKAQVNPHFLSNGLAAIQALILKGDNDKAAQYLAKFSFLMRKILYYSEARFISVKQELELLDAYLELELLRFRNRFHIQKEIHLSETQLNEFQFPSLLLQPILENAIWHGLKFQENNPKLGILLHLNKKQELVVQVTDNGHGFSTSKRSEEHLSKGNQLINERIDALNQQFQKQVASIEVDSSTSGTTVTFTFSPLLYQSGKI